MKRATPSAEDRLIAIQRLEHQRLGQENEGIASLLEDAARAIRSARPENIDCRAWLSDELKGAAILLRRRKT